MSDEIPEDVPDEFIPDPADCEIGPLTSEHEAGGIVHGLGEVRDAPKVFEFGDDQRRYRVQGPDGSGALANIETWECSCGLAESLGYCFHLRAAAVYDHRRGGDEDT